MMKNNLAAIVPQISMMAWINHFFSGFILCEYLRDLSVKLPFALTEKLKVMMQRGVNLEVVLF